MTCPSKAGSYPILPRNLYMIDCIILIYYALRTFILNLFYLNVYFPHVPTGQHFLCFLYSIMYSPKPDPVSNSFTCPDCLGQAPVHRRHRINIFSKWLILASICDCCISSWFKSHSRYIFFWLRLQQNRWQVSAHWSLLRWQSETLWL